MGIRLTEVSAMGTQKSMKQGVLVIALAITCFAQIDAHTIIERSVQANTQDWNAPSSYDYFERDQQPGAGTKTYDVLMILGSPYRRLVAVNGVALSPEQEAQERQKLAAVLIQRRNESDSGKAERIAEYERGRKCDQLLMEQMTKAMDFALVGEEQMDGHDVYVLKATPRADYQPPNMEAEVLRGMEGKLWIDKATFQWVRVEAHVIRSVSIEGFLARVEPGTRFELEKMPVEDDIWLPKHFAMKSEAKVLLFFTRRSRTDETYYNYHRTPGEQTPAGQ